MKFDISKKSFSFQLIFWMALGPFFLVAILSALMMQFADGQWALSIAAMSGLFLCWLFQSKGFVASAALIAFMFFVQPPLDIFGSLCCVVPILAALFLTGLCMQEVKDMIAAHEAKVDHLLSLRSGLEQEVALKTKLFDENKLLRSQLDENTEWVTSLKRLMNVGQKESMLARERVEDVEQRLAKAYERIKQLEEAPPIETVRIEKVADDLTPQLNDLRVRHYQMELLGNQYRDQLKTLTPKLQLLAELKARNLQLEHQLKQRPEPVLAPAPEPVKKEQLREQFEEKDQQLHAARKERYEMESELAVTKRQVKEQDHELDAEVKILCEQLEAQESLIAALEAEVELARLVRNGQDFDAATCDE